MAFRVCSAFLVLGHFFVPQLSGSATAEELVYKYVHCDVEYEIQEGDTLIGLSEAAYGAQRNQLIYSRNSQVISMVESLPVGQTIILPCAEGNNSFTPDEEAMEEAAELGGVVNLLKEEGLEPAEGAVKPIRLLTSDHQEYLVDKEAEGQGLSVQIINQAFLQSEAETTRLRALSFINDRDAHLRDLLMDGSFDIGFPWVLPPCNDPSLPSLLPTTAWMCENFTFSEPIYEYVQAIFTNSKDSWAPNSLTDLQGRSICLAGETPRSRLTLAGVTEAETNLVSAPDAAGCVALLRAEEVDAIIADATDIERLEIDALKEAEGLADLVSFHAIAPNNKPTSVEALEQLDQGLIRIRENGRWFRLIRAHLLR